MSANSPADLPLRGNVVASPREGSSRGFQIGEPIYLLYKDYAFREFLPCPDPFLECLGIVFTIHL
ncbi:hypothetical protein ALC53_02041 [Atta colombica]|uniref:Uncharacterized protein n=1 Tax=Atta colombica TaxID=520822 RepID=A0A195BTH5_9HYME|nr:hypothetical protein ALC53_02041 [Atta colombica]